MVEHFSCKIMIIYIFYTRAQQNIYLYIGFVCKFGNNDIPFWQSNIEMCHSNEKNGGGG